MEELKLIVFVFIVILSLVALVLFPLIVEKALEASVPFKAEETYDISYNKRTKILSFKTNIRRREYVWKYKGSCTVWYDEKGRCNTLFESELYKIWKIAIK